MNISRDSQYDFSLLKKGRIIMGFYITGKKPFYLWRFSSILHLAELK